MYLINGVTDSSAFITEICAADNKALLHICPLKRLNAVFFLSVCLSIEREQKATAAANIIYLGGRICTLCQWTAPGLLCASIHYRHKALDVSPLHLFPALSTRHTSSVRPLRAGGACSPGRRSNGEECQRGRVELTSCVCCAESSVGVGASERLSGNPSSILPPRRCYFCDLRRFLLLSSCVATMTS